MWRSLKNIVRSFWTYSDLSPDLRVRRHVNRVLQNRSCLNIVEWHQIFWQPLDISRQISEFVYQQMQEYSGLEFGRVQPSDRLIEDLKLPLTCWFDWELFFCDAFWENFGIELGESFSIESLKTMEDLMLFLNRQLLSVNRS